jgi:hypothetical protein
MESSERPFLTDLKKDVADYVELRLNIWRLHAIEKAARVSSAASFVLLQMFLLLFFLLFLFMAIGFYLSSKFGSYALGFGAVSLFYLALMLVFMALRKKIFETYLTDKIVEALSDDKEEIQ